MSASFISGESSLEIAVVLWVEMDKHTGSFFPKFEIFDGNNKDDIEFKINELKEFATEGSTTVLNDSISKIDKSIEFELFAKFNIVPETYIKTDIKNVF